MQPANEGENVLTALIAGTTSASLAALMTYPFDCLKTQQQLNNQALMLKYHLQGNFPGTLAQIFKGSSALVIGSVFKNSTRILLYNWLSKFMAIDTYDSRGEHKQKTTAPRIVIAGLMSGFFETLCLIPFENIKIAMVQNMTLVNEITRNSDINLTGQIKHHHPHSIFNQYLSPHAYYTSEVLGQLKGHRPSSKFLARPSKPSKKDALKMKYNKSPSLTFLGTIKEIYSLKGINGFTAGTCITMIRQVAISTVWLSTYNATRQLLDPHNKSPEQGWFGHKHTAIQVLGLHILSSTAVIATTQPLDVVKTHIQSKNGKVLYKDSLSTAYKLVLEQGIKSMYKGALPRSLKVLVNGGLTASLYSVIEEYVSAAGQDTLFTD